MSKKKLDHVTQPGRIGKLSKVFLPLGKRVIVMGGAIYGVQTAKFLLDRGRQVIVVEESDELGRGMIDCGPKPNSIQYLMENGVEFHKSLRFVRVTDKGLVIRDLTGSERLIEADSIVTALPMSNNLALNRSLQEVVPELYAVGVCNPTEETEPVPPLMLQPMDNEPIWPGFTVPAVRAAYKVVRKI